MAADLFFVIKNIKYFGSNRMILLQNENGPCPLLAVANALLLENKLKGIHEDQGVVSLSQLTALIANLLVEMKDKIATNEATSDNSTVYHQDQLNSVLDILPKLANGLDLNVCFRDVHDFEFTEEIGVFDGLGVNLVHGWMLDTQDKVTTNVMQAHGCTTYNHLMFKLVEYKNLIENTNKQPIATSTSVTSDDFINVDTRNDDINSQLMENGHILEEFLSDTASQLTYMGLLTLHHTLKERQLAVFFRNNHFATIFKNNSQLYLLVTDLGYQDQPNVVWECLDAVDGNTEYVDSNFKPASFVSTNALNTTANNYVTLDLSSLLHQPQTASAAGGTIALPPQIPSTGASAKTASTVAGTIALPPRGTAAISSDSERMSRPTGIPQFMNNEYDDFYLAKKLQEEEDHAFSVHTSDRDNCVLSPPIPVDLLNPDNEFHRLGLSPEEIELIKNEEAYYDSRKNQRNQVITNTNRRSDFATGSNNANPTRSISNTNKDKDSGCVIM